MSAASKKAWRARNRERARTYDRNAYRAARGLPLEPLPPNWRAVQTTTVVDAEGETKQQSIVARPSEEVPYNHTPDGFAASQISTLVDARTGRALLQWIQARPEERDRWARFWAAAEAATERYRGISAALPVPVDSAPDRLVLVPIGDPHLGMLSWARETGVDFDVRIAERECLAAIDRLFTLAPPAAKCIVANMGDFFHAEDNRQQTPHGGNKLDVDTRSGKVSEIGFGIARRIVDSALAKYPTVEWIGLPGNHDPHLAYMLTLWLRAVYENEPRVVFGDDFNPYRYARWGKTLLGFHHGDGAKPEAMPGIMAADRAPDWGETLFHYVWMGHVHTRRVYEAPMCLVETVRTLAPRDFWTHWKGFRSGQSIQAIAYDLNMGEESRVTVDIRAVR